jgi:ketosteroid isomerase-like protein
MSQLNLDVVRGVYDAFDSRDLEAVLSHVDDDVEVLATEGLPWSGRYYGRDGFADFISAVEDHVRITIETDELIASGESVAQIGRIVGEVHQNGTHFHNREIHIWGLRAGKIVSFQNYVDTQAQRAALGLPFEEPPPDYDPENPDRVRFWS